MSARIVLRGEYDVWRRAELQEQLGRADLSGDVVIDLGRTTLIDAGAAALLIALRKRLYEANPSAQVVLMNAPRAVRRVLDICRAGDLFVFSTDR